MIQQYDNLKMFDRRTDVKVLPIKQFFAEMGMEDVDYDSRVALATKLSTDYDTILKMMNFIPCIRGRSRSRANGK